MERKCFLNRRKNAWLFGLAAGALALCLSSPLQTKASGDKKEDTITQTNDNTVDLLQAGIVASGVDNGCYWELDSNGNMNITSAAPGSNLRRNGWSKYRKQIKTLNVDVPYSSHLTDLFSDLPYLESAKIKIDQCSGSASGMFYNSSSSNLEYLDLSGLNTYGITDMTYMFYNCNSLKSLNLGNFNTSCVTDMSSMFNSCEKIESTEHRKF